MKRLKDGDDEKVAKEFRTEKNKVQCAAADELPIALLHHMPEDAATKIISIIKAPLEETRVRVGLASGTRLDDPSDSD